MGEKKERLFYFDFLRAISCFMVIIVHTAATVLFNINPANLPISFNGLPNYLSSPDYWIANILDSICRISVPLFIMISGALFLNESYHFTGKKMAKHIVRMCIVYVVWSLLYAIFFEIIMPSIDGKPVISEFFWNAFRDGHYHLWFIPMLIGLYLITPIFRLLVKKDNRKYVEYFLILAIIFQSVFAQAILMITRLSSPENNVLASFVIVLDKVKVYQVLGYIGYFVLGWYLSEFDIKHKKIFYILGGICLLTTIFGAAGLTFHVGHPDYLFYEFCSINIVGNAMVAFVLAKQYLKNKENAGWFRKGINLVSKQSFGIYLLHVFVMFIFQIWLGPIFEPLSAALYIPIVAICTLVGSFLLSYVDTYIVQLLKMIPFIRKVFY